VKTGDRDTRGARIRGQARVGRLPGPRYTARPLPATRYLPGRTPRPSSTQALEATEAAPTPLDLRRWWENAAYLYAIDLFNARYWWECHEALEGLWRAAGRGSETGALLQGLIQLAAASLKRELGQPNPARALGRRALAKLRLQAGVVLGIDVPRLVTEAEEFLEGQRRAAPRIRLRRPV
jgi:hypothetical protein